MKEVNEKYMKKIYLNILKAILIITYFFVLNLTVENVSALNLERGIELCTMLFLFIAIFIFELAYKRDDDDLAIQGIEVLVLSAYTLTSQYIAKRFNFDFKTYSLAASYLFAIYFILKCIFVYTKGRREMANDMSDIKEIVKKKQPIKKEAKKKKIEEQNVEKIDVKKSVQKNEEDKKMSSGKTSNKTNTKQKNSKTTVKKTNTKVSNTKASNIKASNTKVSNSKGTTKKTGAKSTNANTPKRTTAKTQSGKATKSTVTKTSKQPTTKKTITKKTEATDIK